MITIEKAATFGPGFSDAEKPGNHRFEPR